jgi:LPS export ABC transporter protein LptC
MMSKLAVLLFFLLVFDLPLTIAEVGKPKVESDQQISDFSLAGYGEKGKKSWDISGKSADIFSEIVKLDSVVGNLYGKEENVKLTAKRGDFNKNDGKVHLEQDVVITTSSGAKLTTNSLDWDRKNQLVSTNDTVNVQRDNMFTVAKGAKGEPNLKIVALERDVKVELRPAEGTGEKGSGNKEKIVITCDGPLEINYEQNLATFNNNVKVERPDSLIYSDKMDIHFNSANAKLENGSLMGSSVDKIVALGNVKIVRGENISYSDEAVYTASDKKIVLKGKPRLVIYSEEDLKNAPPGN